MEGTTGFMSLIRYRISPMNESYRERGSKGKLRELQSQGTTAIQGCRWSCSGANVTDVTKWEAGPLSSCSENSLWLVEDAGNTADLAA